MRKINAASIVLLLLGASLLLLAGCASTPESTPVPEPVVGEAEEPEEEAVVELFGDPIRGGLLYDKWWKPLGLDAPEEDHALWATQSTNTRTGDGTWRCKECHGWDYKGADGAYGSGSHFTGFTGVLQFAGGDANEVLAALQGATNSDHDFSSVMDEQALIDLALFITDESMDYSTVAGDDNVALSSDLGTGEDLFADACVECHGPEGLAINFSSVVSDPDYVAAIANGNPWEFMHKMRVGQPGTDMPSSIDNGWTSEEEAAVLAYAQTLPNISLVSQGGLIYDKWWVALGLDEPTEDHPLWATQTTNERSGKDTWRCKECHGWDYQGADGAYGSGSHYTGFTGAFGASTMSTEEIFAWLDGTSNTDHDFSAFFDEAAMTMMATFLQEGTVDMSTYVNEDKSANGDVDTGSASYEIACSRCHGDDGQGINFGDDDDPTYLGDVANGNPWETLHKSANGQPGEGMPSGFNLGWTWQNLADLLAYLQTLPGAGE